MELEPVPPADTHPVGVCGGQSDESKARPQDEVGAEHRSVLMGGHLLFIDHEDAVVLGGDAGHRVLTRHLPLVVAAGRNTQGVKISGTKQEPRRSTRLLTWSCNLLQQAGGRTTDALLLSTATAAGGLASG